MSDEGTSPETISEALRAEIIGRIERSARGKYTLKIRTLMEVFGYRAVQRLRQSSLLAVVSQLENWGITATLPGGATATDWITLTLSGAEPQLTRPSEVAPPPAATTGPGPQVGEEDVRLDPHANPLAFAFNIADVPERERSVAICHDILAAVWSFRPVCLHIEASDEFFSFAAGFLSAVLRRRRLMGRRLSIWDRHQAIAPEVLSIDEIKTLLAPGRGEDFPESGAVYLVRDVPDDIQDDELIASLREMYLPHTYRLKARFATTTSEPGTGGRRAVDDEQFASVRRWLCAFAGAPSIDTGAADHFVDLASLLAEAAQIGDVLAHAAAQPDADPAFRAGFESSEHVILKNSVLRYLRRTYPGETITVETLLDAVEEDEDEDGFTGTPRNEDPERRVKPDIRIGTKLAVEIEALRALARPGTNAFFGLENKLRQKLPSLSGVEELWIVVPSDVAMLAAEHLSGVARSLQRIASTPRIRLAHVDLHQDRPVFFQHDPLPRGEPVIRGASWRESRKPSEAKKLTWKDVAGYSDLKQRIHEDVLEPLRNPDKYSRYGIGAPNGLLLYGLPGCGKSLVGRVLAGEADLVCRIIAPSDLTSMWLGEGVKKIRELFDWALKQAPCLLVIDEVDAIAPQRREHNMHTDEKRQVNELLAQLDRIADKRVAVVATTNYVSGIDTAIRRSGRFDVKIPVFPPTPEDRRQVFAHYLNPERLPGVDGLEALDMRALAEATPLYAPADIKAFVDTALRRAVHRAAGDAPPRLVLDDLRDVLRRHQRSIRRDEALDWIAAARTELGPSEEGLLRLEAEVRQVYGE